MKCLLVVLLSLTFDELVGFSKATNRNSLKETKVLFWKQSLSRMRNTLNNTIHPCFWGSSLTDDFPLFCASLDSICLALQAALSASKSSVVFWFILKLSAWRHWTSWSTFVSHYTEKIWNGISADLIFSGMGTGYWKISQSSSLKILCAL